MDREILKWLNATISLRAASQRWLWCSCISSAPLPSWSAYRPRQPRLGVEAAASAVAVSVAEAGVAAEAGARSEEHTSELQSHLNLVCRLLLEKKKKKNAVYWRDCSGVLR